MVFTLTVIAHSVVSFALPAWHAPVGELLSLGSLSLCQWTFEYRQSENNKQDENNYPSPTPNIRRNSIGHKGGNQSKDKQNPENNFSNHNAFLRAWRGRRRVGSEFV